jgi:cystathionine beta-lyase/cystathionine gamma-synthase
VERVSVPFDESFPQYELAMRQMKGGCGLLSFVIEANRMEQVVTFCESLRHILMAVSWGGYESLIIPKCASLLESEFDASNPDHRMLRFYVGLEDAEYLVDDLENAFDAI